MSKFRDWIFVLGVIFILIGAFYLNISPYSQPYSLFQLIIVLLAIPWFLIVKYKRLENNLLISIFAFFGKISYPLYLLHQVIGISVIKQLSTSFSKIASISLTLLLLLISSYIIHVFVEIKFANYLKKKLC